MNRYAECRPNPLAHRHINPRRYRQDDQLAYTSSRPGAMWRYFRSRIVLLAEWIIASLLYGVGLFLWILLQWAFAEYCKPFVLTFADEVLVTAFQWILGVATLFVPLFCAYGDIMRMMHQIKREVARLEREDSRKEQTEDGGEEGGGS